ncbi:MAG: DUF4421 family protein [Bacteroidota bacterium]
MRQLLLAILCFLFSFVSGQTEKPSLAKRLFTRAPYDTSYVASYYDHFLHVTALGVLQSHDIGVSNDRDKVKINFAPNTAFRFGFGLDYRYFSLEFSQIINAIDAPDPKKGNTDNFSLRLGVTGRRLLGSMLIQSYRGVYITNPQQVFPNWNINNPIPLRSDIVSEVLLGSLNYFFNHERYSTMASLWQIDRQKKSAGSFTAGITASIAHLKADSSFIPLELTAITNPGERLKEGYNYMVGLNAGYGYNFIFLKKFFINGLIIPGIDFQVSQSTNVNDSKLASRPGIGYHGDLRLIAGYNGNRYYGGAHYSNYYIVNRVEADVDVDMFNGYIRLFIGRRFDLTPSHKKK